MNNKSRIALAIAAALGTAAMGASAQTSTVQIGGSLNMFYSIASPGHAGSKKHDNLSLSEPELWIHGEEKIGNMTAWFRCTSSFDLMGTGAGAGEGQLCGRNSGMGFKGGFGNIFFGTWDTPAKLVASVPRSWFGGTASLTGGFARVVLNGSGSNTGNVGNTFWERRARSINYHSPSFSGFGFKAMYSASNEETAIAASSPLSPRTFGASVDYNNGPLYVGLGYEQHNDFNPASQAVGGLATQYNGGEDKNWLLGASYTFGFGTRLGGVWSRSTYDVTNTTDAKKTGWALFVEHNLSGPHKLKAQYYKGGDTKGNATVNVGSHRAAGPDTGAYGWTVAYMYDMSKRTQAGFVYGVMNNDRLATYNKGVSSAVADATQKVYGLNIRHRF